MRRYCDLSGVGSVIRVEGFIFLPSVSLLLTTLLTSSSHANAQQIDPHTEARKSFVKLTVESPTLPKGATDNGSGVLISIEGHILTAAHVVASAVDDGSSDFDVFPRAEAKVLAQFVNDLEQLETTLYEATVQYYSTEADIALLKIEVPPEVVAFRHVPTLDPASAHVTCAECFVILGYTSRGFEWTPASPGQAVQGNYKRLLISNMTRGYSGGPIFHKSTPSQWTLVGIGISGDPERQMTNFMVTLHAADDALGLIRERLSYIERPPFPSQRFKDWAGISFQSEDDAELKAFVERKLKANPSDFVRRVLNEDFLSVVYENKRLANTAKKLLEHSIQVMVNQRGTTDLSLFTPLVVRLVALYGLLDVNQTLIVARWREDILVQRARCDRLSKGADVVMLHRCWQRLDVKQHYLVVRVIKKAFIEAFGEFQQQRKPRLLVQWSTTQLEQLIEWGDILSVIGSETSIESLHLALRIFVPVFIDRTRLPPTEHDESPRIPFRAAAEDKYDEALSVLSVPERQPKLKNSFARIGEFRKKVCSGIKREIKALRDLLNGHPYSRHLEKKLKTEISSYCS